MKWSCSLQPPFYHENVQIKYMKPLDVMDTMFQAFLIKMTSPIMWYIKCQPHDTSQFHIERYLMCFELNGIQNMEFRTTLSSSLNNLGNKNKWLKHSTNYARTALLKNVHTNHKNTYEIRALTSSMPHDCG